LCHCEVRSNLKKHKLATYPPLMSLRGTKQPYETQACNIPRPLVSLRRHEATLRNTSLQHPSHSRHCEGTKQPYETQACNIPPTRVIARHEATLRNTSLQHTPPTRVVAKARSNLTKHKLATYPAHSCRCEGTKQPYETQACNIPPTRVIARHEATLRYCGCFNMSVDDGVPKSLCFEIPFSLIVINIPDLILDKPVMEVERIIRVMMNDLAIFKGNNKVVQVCKIGR